MNALSLAPIDRHAAERPQQPSKRPAKHRVLAHPVHRQARAYPKQHADHEIPVRRVRIHEHESVRLSLENLMTFPWVREPVAAGKLSLHGCFFDIRSGILERLGDDGSFHPVAEK